MPAFHGISCTGHHTTHCAASPGSQTRGFAGTTWRCSGRIRFSFYHNEVIDRVQRTRSATTVPSISARGLRAGRVPAYSTTLDDSVGDRLERGRADEANAFATPAAASRRIKAQSSDVITPNGRVSLFSVKTDSFSSVVDNGPNHSP